MEYNGPINRNPGPNEASISIYLYKPWMGGAIAGVVTFGITMVIQLYYMFSRGRGVRWFHGLLAFGSLMEVGGYAARIKGHANMFYVPVFVAQYFLIVVAPIPIAAAIYLMLTYAAKRFPNGHRMLAMKPNWIVGFFVFMDIVTIAVQVAGAALVGAVQSKKARGETSPVSTKTAGHILLAGLAVQTASFSGFLCLLLVAIARHNTLNLPAVRRHHLRTLLLMNLTAAILILLRTVYRLAVECQGYFGSANSSQTLFTCLEYLPVILALAVLSAVPISRFFPSDYDRDFLTTPVSPEVKDHY